MPHLTMIDGRKRADTLDLEQGYDTHASELRSERREVTRDIESILRRAAVDRSNALSQRDCEDFIQMGITDTALEAGGAITEREKLQCVREMKSHALNFVNEARVLGDAFLREITQAESKGWITVASATRWGDRLKQHSGSWLETMEFLQSFDKKYIENWKKLSMDLEEVKELKTTLNVDAKTIKELQALEQKDFAEAHYLDKRNAVSFALAALKTHEKNTKESTKLHRDTLAVLIAAANEKILSKKKIGPWLDHVISGERTLKEVKAFVVDWRRVRLWYNDIENQILEQKRDPQGFKRMPLEKFLEMSYKERLQYVQSAKWRLDNEKDIGPDTPIKDRKGKIRHALDQHDWEEAEYFLRQAWTLKKTEDDRAELQSMEKYLRAFAGGSKIELQAKRSGEEVRNAYEEIATLLSLLPIGLQPIYRKALSRGADCLQCVTTTVFNRTWCHERGYLTEALEEDLKQQSIEETAERLRPSGKGHGDGRQNANVDGFHQPAIRDKGIGPQNVFLSGSGADSFLEKADSNKYTWSFWYWTNLIVEGVSAGQNAYVATSLNYRFKRAARTLQRHGLFWSPVGPPLSLN